MSEFRLPRFRKLDGPTLAVTAALYGGWLGATAWHAAIPTPILFLLGGWLLAWHGSLQHETIHGHPTGNVVVDRAIGFVPLSLWLPYSVYRRSHLAHHGCGAITDPRRDPESRYHDRRRGFAWAFGRLHASLVGQLLLGPPISIVRFLANETARFRYQPRQVARDWAPHLIAVAGLLWWLDHVGLSIARYALTFLYPGTMLTMLRSFAEHNAGLATSARAVSVERGGPLALLYLNNNLHAAHHERPMLAWYELPAYHHAHRQRFAREGAVSYASYSEVARRFAFRAHDDMLHPAHREPA